MAVPGRSNEHAVIATITEGVDIGLYGIKAYDNGEHLCTRFTRSEFLSHPSKVKWFMYNWQIARFFRFLDENDLSLHDVHKQSNETMAKLVRYLVNDAILDGDALVKWIAEVTEWSKSRAEQYVKDPTKIKTTRYPDPSELQKRRLTAASISPTAVTTPGLIVTPTEATYPTLATQLQGQVLDDDRDEGIDTIENDATRVIEGQDNAISADPEDEEDAPAAAPTFPGRMLATDRRATTPGTNADFHSHHSTRQPRLAHPARPLSSSLPNLEDESETEGAVQLHARIMDAQKNSYNLLQERMARLELSNSLQPLHSQDLASMLKAAAPPSRAVQPTSGADSGSGVAVAGPSKPEGKGKGKGKKQAKVEEHDEAEQEAVYKPTARATTAAAQQPFQRPALTPTSWPSHLHQGIPESSVPRLQSTSVASSLPGFMHEAPGLGLQGPTNMASRSVMAHASPALFSSPAGSFLGHGLPLPPLLPVSMTASQQGRQYASLSPPTMPWMHQQQQVLARQHSAPRPQLSFGTPLSFSTGMQPPLAQVRGLRPQQQVDIGHGRQQGELGLPGLFVQGPTRQQHDQQPQDE